MKKAKPLPNQVVWGSDQKQPKIDKATKERIKAISDRAFKKTV